MFKEDFLKIFGNKSLGDLSIILVLLPIVQLSMYLCSYYFDKNILTMFILGFWISLFLYLLALSFGSKYQLFREFIGGNWVYDEYYKFYRRLSYLEEKIEKNNNEKKFLKKSKIEAV